MVDTVPPDREPLKAPEWASFGDDRLLEVRMCDLGVTIDGTELELRIAEVNAELDARSVACRTFRF